MRYALALAALVIAGLPACADEAPLTCDTFKQALNETIHAQGDLVATPKDYYILRKDELPRVLYGFSGIVGIKGDLNCANDGAFRQFSFKADTQAKSDEQEALILQRIVALSSAAMCAGGVAPEPECLKKASDLVVQTVHIMKAEHDRGEPMPHGEAEMALSDVAGITIETMPDAVSVEVVNYR